jgi:hypothetical protein
MRKRDILKSRMRENRTFGSVISPLYIALLTLSGMLLLLTGMINLIIPRIRYRKEPKYQSEYKLNFTEENLKFITGDIDSTISWDYYKEAYENKDFYFLVYMRDAYSIIPKRVFKTQENIDEFRCLVESKLGKIKRK